MDYPTFSTFDLSITQGFSYYLATNFPPSLPGDFTLIDQHKHEYNIHYFDKGPLINTRKLNAALSSLEILVKNGCIPFHLSPSS